MWSIIIKNKRVIYVNYLDEDVLGCLHVEAIPEPEIREGFVPVLMYDERLYYEYEPRPAEQEPAE